jgi:hypothetical protein
MDIQSILLSIIGILLGVVSFFLRSLWVDIKNNKENMGKLKGKIELAEQKSDQLIDKVSHINNLKIQQLTEKLDIFCRDIKEDINKLSDEIMIMNRGSIRIDRDEKGRFIKMRKEDV